jgi:hypothetical protein
VIKYLFDTFVEEGDRADLDADHLLGDKLGGQSIGAACGCGDSCACCGLKKRSTIHDLWPFEGEVS